MTMSPDEQMSISITAISFEVTARAILEGIARALRAGASRELILRDYTLDMQYQLDQAQACALAVTLALMLAEKRVRE